MMLLISTFASAQKVDYDVTEDGIRIVTTDLQTCRSMKDKIVLNVGVSAAIGIERKDTILSVLVELTSNTPIKVLKDGLMLIKLQDNTVLQLKSNAEKEDQIGKLSNVNGFTFKTYSITCYFDATREQLEEIASKGVIKVRIDTKPDMYDKEFKKDQVGKAISARLPLLLDKISKSNSITDGF